MCELDYITITGFKSIKSLEKFPLHPINVIIGSNGSGKSNFISSLFHRLDEENLKEWLEDYSLGQLWEKNVLG